MRKSVAKRVRIVSIGRGKGAGALLVVILAAWATDVRGQATAEAAPREGAVFVGADKIVLLAADGLSNQRIAQRLDMPRQIVSKWRKRFHERRLEGLEDDPRPGRPPGFCP